MGIWVARLDLEHCRSVKGPSADMYVKLSDPGAGMTAGASYPCLSLWRRRICGAFIVPTWKLFVDQHPEQNQLFIVYRRLLRARALVDLAR